MKIIDLSSVFGTVIIEDLVNDYIGIVKKIAGSDNVISLVGNCPIWLYLKVVNALSNGKRKISYHSPIDGYISVSNNDVDVLHKKAEEHTKFIESLIRESQESNNKLMLFLFKSAFIHGYGHGVEVATKEDKYND